MAELYFFEFKVLITIERPAIQFDTDSCNTHNLTSDNLYSEFSLS